MSCFNTKIQLFNISFNCIFISTLTWISHGQHLNASKTCTQLFRDTWPNLFFLSLIPCKTDTHPPIYARSFFLCCSGKDSCPLSRAGRVQNSCTCLGKPLTCTHWRLPPAQCSFPTPSPLHTFHPSLKTSPQPSPREYKIIQKCHPNNCVFRWHKPGGSCWLFRSLIACNLFDDFFHSWPVTYSQQCRRFTCQLFQTTLH